MPLSTRFACIALMLFVPMFLACGDTTYAPGPYGGNGGNGGTTGGGGSSGGNGGTTGGGGSGGGDSQPDSAVCGNGRCELGEFTGCPGDCPTCQGADCAHQICEAFCDRAVGCGFDITRSECLREYCSWLIEDPSTVDPRCWPSAGAYYGCVWGQSCATMGDASCDRESSHMRRDCVALPSRVEVVFYEALIAPRKSDGCMWDVSCNPLTEQQRRMLATLLDEAIQAAASAANPAVGAALSQIKLTDLYEWVIGLVLETAAKPDGRGTIIQRSGGTVVGTASVGKTQDSFTASLERARFGARLSRDVSFDIDLEDADAVYDDPINVGRVSYDDLVLALVSDEPVWVVASNTPLGGVLHVRCCVWAD